MEIRDDNREIYLRSSIRIQRSMLFGDIFAGKGVKTNSTIWSLQAFYRNFFQFILDLYHFRYTTYSYRKNRECFTWQDDGMYGTRRWSKSPQLNIRIQSKNCHSYFTAELNILFISIKRELESGNGFDLLNKAIFSN